MQILSTKFRALFNYGKRNRRLFHSIQIPRKQHQQVSAAATLGFDPVLDDRLLEFASKKATGVSLKGLLDFGSNPTENTLLRAAIFLHHELPIRIAKRVVELDNLPYGLSNISSIRHVKSWYIRSFEDIIKVSRGKGECFMFFTSV